MRWSALLSCFHQLVLRYAARHRLIGLFNILSIALGVAVYLAIQLANHSARSAFEASLDLVSGKSHLEVRAPDGQLDEMNFTKLHSHPLIAAVTPVVEGYAILADYPGEYLHLFGTDLFTNLSFQTINLNTSPDPDSDRDSGGEFEIERFLGQPDGITISPGFAREKGLRTGDTLTAVINGENRSLNIIAFNRPADKTREEAHRNLAVMDIGWAQELLGRSGRLTSLQIQLKDPRPLEASATAIRSLLPPNLLVQPPARRSQQVNRMLAGFELNLTAMSLVSILVGVFLIYNTNSASVVRRRREIGILRSLGTSRLQIQSLFLSEALVYGLLGVALGVAGGFLLGTALLATVSKTISLPYILVSISELSFSGLHVLQAVAYGLAATVLGAWLPAREASRLEPAIVLRAGAKAAVRKPAWGSLFLIGLACLFVAALFARLSLNPGPDWLSFVACFFLLTGWSLMVPMISRLLSRALDRALSITRQAAHRPYAMLLKMSATQFERSLHRTSVTVAALMAAVAMLIGVTVMISSFRQTIETWMQRSLVADLFLSPASQLVLGVHDTLPPRLRTFLTDQPEVESVDSFRQVQVVMPDGDEIGLGVVDGPRRDNLSFKTGNASQILSFFYNNDAVMVSEPLAQRYGLRRGEEVLLPTPSGTQSFPIAGVFYDYTDDRGVLFMRRSTYRQFWDDPKEQSLAIYLKDGVNQSESGMSTILGERIRQAFGQEGAFLLLSNGEIREEVRRIFNQTFAVTSMLRSIAIIVALIGIILTLTTLVQERGREIGVLRSIGASRWQICQLFLGEASLIGLASSLIGMAAGIALAVILTTFVNLAFFGWTIPLNLPLGEILPTPVWVTIVACLAGLVPAYKAASLPLNKAVRME